MKRKGYLMEELISEENIKLAIADVNRGHRRYKHSHKPNKVVLWVEETESERIEELRRLVLDKDFMFSPTRDFQIYDKSAGKYRNVHEPRLYPDQYIHHMIVQALKPILMKNMDYWSIGSIKGRGAMQGINGIKKWMKNDRKGTKWCLEADIYHFYDELSPALVVDELRKKVKDKEFLYLVEKMTEQGINIGAYYSQWFANMVLQPIDAEIRKMGATHSLRYMDNFTIFSTSKKKLHKIKQRMEEMLAERGLRLKGNWQIFKVDDRPVTALGYRFGHGFCMLRKRNLFRIKRQLSRYYHHAPSKASVHEAESLISRMGQLNHCDSYSVTKLHIKKGTKANLKKVVRTKCLIIHSEEKEA